METIRIDLTEAEAAQLISTLLFEAGTWRSQATLAEESPAWQTNCRNRAAYFATLADKIRAAVICR